MHNIQYNGYMNKEEIEKQSKEFSDKYGELMLLKANIAAINQILIKRDKSGELYQNMSEIMKDFDKKMTD